MQGLVLPALEILEGLGRHCPQRLVAEASPEGGLLLARLLDPSDRAMLSTFMPSRESETHA